MIILVLNCGSSSLKYALYDWSNHRILIRKVLELSADNPNQLRELLRGVINSSGASQISAVGHRVVHGGSVFKQSVMICGDVLDQLKKLSEIAPLHNPPNILGIESAMELLPHVPQVAVFDTAFHHTLPEVSFTYPLPYEWYEKHQVRRYGFHGTSHLYVSRRAARFLEVPAHRTNLIILHIGSGVSVCAVREGISVDISMGFTPLEGAMMGSRSGDIDPAIVSFMSDRLGVDAGEITHILNTKSGHLGVTGYYSDRRDIVNAAHNGDERSQLSLDMEVYRLKKYIGAYLAVLGRVDAIVFTAGVGENSAVIRAGVLQGLEPFGIKLDEKQNARTVSSSGETLLSTGDSPIKILMIPTDEEAVLVEDVAGLLEGRYEVHTKYVYRFED